MSDGCRLNIFTKSSKCAQFLTTIGILITLHVTHRQREFIEHTLRFKHNCRNEHARRVVVVETWPATRSINAKPTNQPEPEINLTTASNQQLHVSTSTPRDLFTNYLTTISRQSYDNAKFTIDLRRTSDLQNSLRRPQGFS